MKIYLLIGSLLMLVTTQIEVVAQSKLFSVNTEKIQSSNPNSLQSKILEKVKARSLGKKVEVRRFNKQVLDQSEIAINVGDNEIVFSLKELDIRDRNDFSWHGNAKDNKGSLVLVFLNNQLAGNICYNGKTYTISPLGTEQVTLYAEHDSPPDHPPAYNNNNVIQMSNGSASTFDATGDVNVTLRLLIAYTQNAQNGAANIGYSDMKLFLQQGISATNQTLINSQVAHRVKLAAGVKVSYTESGDFSTDLQRFQSTADGYMDEIHTYRNSYSGDVCSLIIDNSSYCGLASQIGSTASTAFCAVHYDCVIGNYSLSHEIGHLHGCRHNTEIDNSNTPYAYGHGYCYTPGGWRTVMAYGCPSPTRIPYFSNPNVLYNGVPTGTVSTNNNALVLNNTAGTLAGFRTAPANLTLTSNANLESGEIGNAVATSLITLSNFYVAANAEFYANAASTSAGSRSILNEDVVDIDLTQEEFSIYPNPNSGTFDLNFLGDVSHNKEVTIFDTKGLEVYRINSVDQKNLKITLPNQRLSTYIVRFKDQFSGKVTTKKLLIN